MHPLLLLGRVTNNLNKEEFSSLVWCSPCTYSHIEYVSVSFNQLTGNERWPSSLLGTNPSRQQLQDD